MQYLTCVLLEKRSITHLSIHLIFKNNKINAKFDFAFTSLVQQLLPLLFKNRFKFMFPFNNSSFLLPIFSEILHVVSNNRI